MPKNIIICSDGTGNTAIKGRGTNVFKLYEALDLNGYKYNQELTPQVAFYDDGVGTENLKFLKLFGGAFGWGLSRNVKQLYAELVRVYEPKDRIFLFGFSRGAFTVRTIADFIGVCGILDRSKFTSNDELLKGVEKAYSKYRRDYDLYMSNLFKRTIYKHKQKQVDGFLDVHTLYGDIPIKFIGVWDTVDAVGTPSKILSYLINKFIYRFKFPNFNLYKEVEHAYHAVSIDDERLTFHPVMWDEEKEEKKNGRIEQVWFTGVHSNVGGGYPKQGMSIVPLYWMMTKAQQSGLRFNTQDLQYYKEHQNVNDKLYNSRSGFAIYYRYKPRNIAKICSNRGVTPKIHISTIERIAQGTDGYAPGNITLDSEIVLTDEKSINTEKIRGIIKNSFAGNPSLLEMVRPWVFLRSFSYYGFLLSSVAAVSYALYDEIKKSGFLALPDKLSLKEIVLLILNSWDKLLYIIIVVIVFYAIGWLSNNKMNRVFSKFWCGILPQLKDALNNINTEKASPTKEKTETHL